MARVVFSTIDSNENAVGIARRLVAENLAACVNIIPNVSSVYKWKGKVEEAGECLLIIKTADDRIARLVKRLPELHPYELPEVISLEITDGLPSYLSWLKKETRPL